MRQLLDNHTFIWFVMGDPRINDYVRSQIENNENRLSIVSVWEIAIKHSIGKLNLQNLSFAEFVEQQIIMTDIQLIDLKMFHILAAALVV